VIYLHGSASNQLEGRYLVALFVPIGIHVFCFDFAGCGNSTAPYITLGFQEHDDLLAAANVLRRDFGIEQIALWGRSMGAAVTMLSLPESDFVCGVADSPYADLQELFLEIGRGMHVPKWLCKRSIKRARRRSAKKVGCDITEVRPLDSCKDCDKPVFFIHGTRDKFVRPRHSQVLYDACPAEIKVLRMVEGTHTTDRPGAIVLEATQFVCRHLGLIVRFANVEDTHIPQGGDQHFADAADMLGHT
jgi:pimeloyl-ACP methyl ester carboxylesterase